MKLLPNSRWAVGGVTLAVWAVAAGSALFWYLRAGDAGAPMAVAAAGAPSGAVQVDTRAVARTLGAPDAPAAAASAADVTARLALRGVVTHQGKGAALISVDGKPPVKPLRVGAAVDGVDGWSVRSVSQRAVVIATHGREARLDMPPMELRSSAGDAVAPPLPSPNLTPQGTPGNGNGNGNGNGASPTTPVPMQTPGQLAPTVNTSASGKPGSVPAMRSYPPRRAPGV